MRASLKHTVPLLCSICCQIYFALFFTSESRSTKKEQNKFDNKLNIKEARWTAYYKEPKTPKYCFKRPEESKQGTELGT